MSEARERGGLLVRLLRFGGVGALAFLVDIGVLQGLIWAGLSPFLARVISISIAMVFAWQMNRHFTFGPSGRGMADEGLRYGLIAVLAAGVNYAVFAALMALVTLPDDLTAFWPIGATAIAVFVSMWVSFAGFQLFAFSKTDRAGRQVERA